MSEEKEKTIVVLDLPQQEVRKADGQIFLNIPEALTEIYNDLKEIKERLK